MRGYPGIRGDNDEEFMDSDGKISEQDAERIVRDPSVHTQASSAIEQSLWKRVAEYASFGPCLSVY